MFFIAENFFSAHGVRHRVPYMGDNYIDVTFQVKTNFKKLKTNFSGFLNQILHRTFTSNFKADLLFVPLQIQLLIIKD